MHVALFRLSLPLYPYLVCARNKDSGDIALLTNGISNEISDAGPYSKTCVKRPLSKRPKIGFPDQLSLNAGQSIAAILLTYIKLPFVIKIFVLSILSDRFTQVLL